MSNDRITLPFSFPTIRAAIPVSFNAEIGTYVSPGTSAPQRQTEVLCPYCREPMMEPIVPAARLLRYVRLLPGGERDEAICQVVPPSHQMVKCVPCNQIFTVPRETSGNP